MSPGRHGSYSITDKRDRDIAVRVRSCITVFSMEDKYMFWCMRSNLFLFVFDVVVVVCLFRFVSF